MERCNTCKHWDRVQPGEFGAIQGAGGCKAARELWGVTESLDDGSRVLMPEHAGLLCLVEDGSHYRAELITMPDFGCVMHEKA